MGFFDFLRKFRVKKRDVFERKIAEIRDVYLNKIEGEITDNGWKNVDILKQLFDWYTEPIAGEIQDTRFRALYVSVNKDPAQLRRQICFMQPTVKKKQKKENPNSDKETTLIPILIRSNYEYERKILKKNIIVKNNEKISKNFNFDWAKKYAQDEANWITNKPRSEEQTYTVNQIRLDIHRNGDYPPLIFALKQLATYPPENYKFRQDDSLYLEWNLRKGLINLKDNTWIDPVISKIKKLSKKVEEMYLLNTSYQNLEKLINSETIKPLKENLTLISTFHIRTDKIKLTINKYVDTPYLLNDDAAQTLQDTLVANFFLIKECADKIGYHFFVKGQTMSAEELFNHIINTIKKACTAKKAKTKKNKK